MNITMPPIRGTLPVCILRILSGISTKPMDFANVEIPMVITIKPRSPKITDWKETNGPVVLATAITSKYRPNIVNPKIFLIIVFYFIASSKKHPKIIH